MNETDSSNTNLFDQIDILQRSLLGRAVLGQWPGDNVSREGLADVFIVKSMLNGLEYNEQGSEISRPFRFRRIWRYIVRQVATNSRTTHWAAEIRGDLYETFRHKEHRLPWEWKATVLMTAEEDWKKEPQRKVVERVHVGTTALKNADIAGRGKVDTNFERGISLLTDSDCSNAVRVVLPAIFPFRRQLPAVYTAILPRDQCRI